MTKLWKQILAFLNNVLQTISGGTLPSFGPLLSIDNHNACFLDNNASVRNMNILGPHYSFDAFKKQISDQKNMGANFVYLYTINEKDGTPIAYSFYVNNDIGGAVDNNKVEEYQKRLKYVLDQNMGIILWLRADDSPTFNRTSLPKQLKYQDDVVKYFDKYTSAYVLGLELDEYSNATQVTQYADHLKSKVNKPIGTHQVSMKFNFAGISSVNCCFLQYGFGKSATQIQVDTQKVVAVLGGKPVYATEYHKTSSSAEARRLGDAAMAGGAKGTGNNRSM